jgi:transposase
LEVAIVAAYKAGMRTKHIAEQFGLSVVTIGNVLWRNGVQLDLRKQRTHNMPTADQVAEMVRLYTVEMLTTDQVAKRVGFSTSSVLRHLGKAGVQMRTAGRAHLLTLEQRKQLVQRYVAGEKFSELETAYGVSCQVVEDCLREMGVRARAPGKRLPATTDMQGRTWFFSSQWDQLYAAWLDREGAAWVYEGRCFKLHGAGKQTQYTPDFVVTIDGVEEYHEVKGWLHEPDAARLRVFAEQYPVEAARLRLIGPKEMAALGLVGDYYSTHPMAYAVGALQADVIAMAAAAARA